VFYRPDEDFNPTDNSSNVVLKNDGLNTDDFNPTDNSSNVVLINDGLNTDNFNPTDNSSNVVLNIAKNVGLNKAEQDTLSCIVENGAITAKQIAMRLSKSERTVLRYLDSLQKKNVIRRIGSRKVGCWEIVASLD
jgi:predicted HTH transcriptional regulator